MLQHLDRETKELLTSKNERKLQRHQANLSAKIEEAHALVTSLVEIKIEQGLEEEEITEWSEDQEETLERYEEPLGLVESELIEIEREKEDRKHDEIEAREEEKESGFCERKKIEDKSKEKLRINLKIDAWRVKS